MNLPPVMPLQRPPAAILRASGLFLDFDGTLVELADRPEAVTVGRRLLTLLQRLSTLLEGRVAILTGREVDDVAAHFQPLDLAIGGSHGHDIRTVGGDEPSVERPPGVVAAIASLRRLEGTFPGVQVEEKALGVAIHYRRAPGAAQQCRDAAEEAATMHGLQLQHGKMVVELKPYGADKGAALRHLMSVPPFAGTTPLFLGDDLTDEHGFEAAAALGGAGVLVGDVRETAALYRLDSVSDALSWLDAAASELE